MGSVPETLNDCAKYHPMKVSPMIAKDLPIFWRPRQSLRRRNTDAIQNQAQQNVKKEVVDKKKKCAHCLCSFGTCDAVKVPMGCALMHFSLHQMNQDNEEAMCAYCGSRWTGQE